MRKLFLSAFQKGRDQVTFYPMHKTNFFVFLFFIVLVLPFFAQGKTIDVILGDINKTLITVIGLLFVLETLGLLWGAARFILSGDPGNKDKARQMMVWSIIAMVVTFAAWGIVQLIVNYFDIQNSVIPGAPGQRNLLPPS
ncbi:MAG: hypothetical protein G01um101466_114 [Parcubacteria group bacterium Gr01-1014_66]|nr:MAG: hypothetical protein G01um101466_114 [Parcubacteria group bacterium Gr01-1014_66]